MANSQFDHRVGEDPQVCASEASSDGCGVDGVHFDATASQQGDPGVRQTGNPEDLQQSELAAVAAASWLGHQIRA